MANHIITVKDLVKKYRKAEHNAVDNITFDVEEGEFFSLLGPNGAGKTTTISILTTTLSKTSGEVTIAGYDVNNAASEVRRSIGIIFQNPSLDLNLTAEENVRFHSVLYAQYAFRPAFNMMPEEYKKKIVELSEVLGIKEDIFKPLKTFSGGMKRKLEIIRSLIHNPKVLFLDEPTSGLDPVSRKNLWEYLRHIRHSNHTIVFLTTHYLEEAEDADHLCIINHGKIVSFGRPDDIKRDLIEAYLIINADDREALRKELASHNLPFTEEKDFKVDIQQQDVQRVIQSIQTPLSKLQTYNPTVEEAYLKIIENGHKEEDPAHV